MTKKIRSLQEITTTLFMLLLADHLVAARSGRDIFPGVPETSRRLQEDVDIDRSATAAAAAQRAR